MFFPWANTYGALAGTISSLVFMTWIGIGGLVNKVSTAVASPLNIDGCPSNLNSSAANMSVVSTTMSAILANTTAAATGGKSYEGVYRLYTLSYLYYTIVGTVTVVVIGLIVSFLTGYTRPSKVDPRLILPLFDVIFPCLPECILRPLRFGVDHKSKLCETTANGTYKVKVDDDDFEMNGIIPATRDEYQSSMSKDNAGYDSSMDFQEDSSTNTKL
ncbi:sodium-dependent multivitamin transporter [Aplysia californica]|uniref:Sodium-dependent multivitamin transporter n=1 Tax=Aplysia californica TaxID=6500 RepID=A0ABM0JRK1_APLCA|nr:sodium-dependent multivitamin transporter [Aplysia californica]